MTLIDIGVQVMVYNVETLIDMGVQVMVYVMQMVIEFWISQSQKKVKVDSILMRKRHLKLIKAIKVIPSEGCVKQHKLMICTIQFWELLKSLLTSTEETCGKPHKRDQKRVEVDNEISAVIA